MLYCREAVQRSRDAGIHRHLHNHLYHFVLGASDVESRNDVHLELRRGISKSGQCRDGGQLSGSEIQTRAGVNLAKSELDKVAHKVWRDAGQACS